MKKTILALLFLPSLLSASFYYPSWDELHEVTAEICQQIDLESVDLLLGVSVGGLVPTALFSIEMKNKNVATISARSYDGRKQGSLVVRNGPERSAVEGKRVLIVDDIVDTGVTVREIKRILLEEYGAASVQIATLFVNREKGQYPDYWGVETNDWVVFPWELEKGEN